MPTPEQLAADAEEFIPADPPATLGMTVLVERLVELKAQLDAIEMHRKEVQSDYDDLRKRYLPQVLSDKGLTSVRTPLGLLSLRYKTRASVPASRRDECRAWLLANDYGHLLTLEPAAALTLYNAFVADGEPYPDFIQTYHEGVAVLTRKKEQE